MGTEQVALYFLLNGHIAAICLRTGAALTMQFLKRFNRAKNTVLRRLKLHTLNTWLNITYRPPRWEPDKVKRVLLLRLDDKIGDMVVTTGTAKQLADNGYHVSVLTGNVCKSMLAFCDAVQQTYLYEKRMSLRSLRAQHFDVVIDFDDVVDYERLRLLFLLAPRHVIGFNKPNSAIYSPKLNWRNSEQHITERHRQVLALFNLPPVPFHYHLGRDPAAAALVAPLTLPADRRLIAINPFTGAEDKDFSREQVQGLIAHIRQHHQECRILLIGHSDKLQSLQIPTAEYVANSTINTAIEIVRNADLVISPDTSIVHIACAFNTPLLAVYNTRRLKDSGLVGYKIWAPNYSHATQIVTACPAIRDLPVTTLIQALDEKLTQLAH